MIFQALKRDPDVRYQTMLELWTDLEVLRHNIPTQIGAHSILSTTGPLPPVSPLSPASMDSTKEADQLRGGADLPPVLPSLSSAKSRAQHADWSADRRSDPQVVAPGVVVSGVPSPAVPDGLAALNMQIAPHPADKPAMSSPAVRQISLKQGVTVGGQPTNKRTALLAVVIVAALLILTGLYALYFPRSFNNLRLEPLAGQKKTGTDQGWSALEKQGEDLYRNGHYQRALETFQNAVAQARDFGPKDTRLATALSNLGTAYCQEDEYAEAEKTLKEALEIKLSREDELSAADTMTDLAMVYCAESRLDKAERLLNRALTIRKRQSGPWSDEVADSMASLAALYNRQGRASDAMKALKQSLDIRNKEKAPNAGDIAQTENSIATDYQIENNLPAARLWFERAMKRAESAYGPNHPLVSDSLVGLASLDFLENKYDDAAARFDRARLIRNTAYGPQNLRTAEVLSCLAILKEHQGKYPEAKPLLLEALQIKKSILGANNPDVVRTSQNYHDLLKHMPMQ